MDGGKRDGGSSSVVRMGGSGAQPLAPRPAPAPPAHAARARHPRGARGGVLVGSDQRRLARLVRRRAQPRARIAPGRRRAPAREQPDPRASETPEAPEATRARPRGPRSSGVPPGLSGRLPVSRAALALPAARSGASADGPERLFEVVEQGTAARCASSTAWMRSSRATSSGCSSRAAWRSAT